MTGQSMWRLMGCVGCAVVLTAATVDAQYGAKADGDVADLRRRSGEHQVLTTWPDRQK